MTNVSLHELAGNLSSFKVKYTREYLSINIKHDNTILSKLR